MEVLDYLPASLFDFLTIEIDTSGRFHNCDRFGVVLFELLPFFDLLHSIFTGEVTETYPEQWKEPAPSGYQQEQQRGSMGCRG
jgi:hypothetical protein